jgi:enoyl-CoA hydratase/carnithine racemase
MAAISLEVRDGIHVMTLTNAINDNALTTSTMHEYLAAFDQVEHYQGETALMITCEHEKTFCTGINLGWLETQNEQEKQEFLHLFETVLCRLALLNAPTVACINGNAYAGGAIMASATDFRLMRADRGRFCFPEVNIRIPFTTVSNAIAHLLPNKQALRTMMLTGAAYTGTECFDNGIVDGLYDVDLLQTASFEMAQKLALKDRVTYASIRNLMRSDIATHLTHLTQS